MVDYVGVCIDGPLDGKKIRHTQNIMPVTKEDGTKFYYILTFGVWWPYTLGGVVHDPKIMWDRLLAEYQASRRAVNAESDATDH